MENQLAKIKVISFDIFQTLVDVNKRIPQIWERILGDDYTKERGQLAAISIMRHYPNAITKALHSKDTFYTMDDVYMECAKEALTTLPYDVTARDIVDSLIYEHSRAPFYKDALSCISSLRNRYQLIVSSDSNHKMVDSLLPVIQPFYAFISDDLHSYKASEDKKFFQQVLCRLNVTPDEILHIGDSSQDIIGAKRAGIPSVWLNRDHRKWNNTYQPDFVIQSLEDLIGILKEGEDSIENY